MVNPDRAVYFSDDATDSSGEFDPSESLTFDRLIHRHLTQDERLSPIRLLLGATDGFSETEISMLLGRPDQLRHLAWLWDQHPPVLLQAIARQDFTPRGSAHRTLLAATGHPLDLQAGSPELLEAFDLMWEAGLFILLDQDTADRALTRAGQSDADTGNAPALGYSFTDTNTDTVVDFRDDHGHWTIDLATSYTGPAVLAIRWHDHATTTHPLNLPPNPPNSDPQPVTLPTTKPTTHTPQAIRLQPTPNP